jgi:SAM-dependent methyltransferase
MNHGYAPAVAEAWRYPELAAEDDRWRHQVYLYLFLLESARRCRGRSDPSCLSVVDVGCGRGGGLSAMTRYGGLGPAVGVDPSEQHIAFCRRLYDGQGLDFRVGTAARLPIPDSSVDLVSSVESSHTYPDIDAFLREARRVLVTGGLLLLADCRAAGSSSARLETHMRRGGMTVLLAEEITERVCEACTLDIERFPRLIGRPKAAFPSRLARAKRNEYLSGVTRYWAFVARNP